MIRLPPRSTLFPYTTLLPIFAHPVVRVAGGGHVAFRARHREAGHRRRALLGQAAAHRARSEEHTSELQSRRDLVCRLLLEKKKKKKKKNEIIQNKTEHKILSH